MDRVSRRILNSKQDLIINNHNPSIGGMTDGQISISQKTGENLSLVIKSGGRIWKTYLSHDGNVNVDKKLTADELKFTRKFTDYRIICHNFSDNIANTKHYVPWFNNSIEGSDMLGSSRSFLVPYKMTLHKLIMRPETLSDATADFTFGLDKQDDGDTTVDSVATVTYSAELASDTMITINRGDWNNNPTVEAGDKVGLSITASATSSGTIDWYITSVWEIEITI